MKAKFLLIILIIFSVLFLSFCTQSSTSLSDEYPYTSDIDGYPNIKISAKDSSSLKEFMEHFNYAHNDEQTTITIRSAVDEDRNDAKDITIEYPEIIDNGKGVKLKIIDAYVKCKNDEHTTYDYDGMFYYITAKVISVDREDSSCSFDADMHDKSGRYLGSVSIFNELISPKHIGKIINCDGILSASNVSKLTIDSY